MKTKNKVSDTSIDTVQVFRDIKEKLSLEMSKMDFTQIKEYLKKGSAEFQQQAKQ